MIKIAFCGAPSVWKTTVAQNFASKLRFITRKNVGLIDEYAKQFVSKFGETTVCFILILILLMKIKMMETEFINQIK